MRGINKAILIGNLGHTPEIKYTASQLAVVKTTLATNRKYKDEEEVTWHNLVFFGKTAEICEQYAKKGSPLYIEGRISNTSYEGRDGTRKYRSEVIVDQMVLLGDGRRTEGARPPNGARDESVALAEKLRAEGVTGAEPEFDDDIPF